MKSVMPFEKFKFILDTIKNYEEKRDKISTFFEEELCSDSWCLFTVGEDLQHALSCLLADEFNCWYSTDYNPAVDELKKELGVEVCEKEQSSTPKWWDNKVRSWENDIEYWLYEDSKKIIIDGEEIPIGTVKDFYNYLVKYCVDKKRD